MVLVVAIMETLYVKTKNEKYRQLAKFWGNIFLQLRMARRKSEKPLSWQTENGPTSLCPFFISSPIL
jgi:hypothetical protein